MSVTLRDLSFSYGGQAVLRGLNLSAAPGERVGVMGSSGGGKSTLLKLVAGLYSPDSGLLEVAGESVPHSIRRRVSMVMQNPTLFPASIRENITCGHPMAEEAVWEACGAAQLAGWIRTLPGGLDTFVGENGSKVSGGQAQRIAIARAIAKEAPVVLLDEATSALDPDTGLAVLQALDRLMEGRTVISVTHHRDTLQGFDALLRLEGGQLHGE